MIYAEANIEHDVVWLKINYPDRKKPVFEKAISYGEAKRRVYFLNREFIQDKLVKWFDQRFYTLNMVGMTVPKQSAEFAIVLKTLKNISLYQLCRSVVDNAAAIEMVAPSESSDRYPYYRDTIRQIIDFCREINGGAQ